MSTRRIRRWYDTAHVRDGRPKSVEFARVGRSRFHLSRRNSSSLVPREATMKPRHLYLGLLVPNSLFVPWVLANGIDPRRFVQALFANGVSAFFGMDVVMSAVALAAFVLIEGARMGL